MHSIAQRLTRLAALLLLAGKSPRRRPVLPCAPCTAHSGAFNYRFQDHKPKVVAANAGELSFRQASSRSFNATRLSAPLPDTPVLRAKSSR